MPFVYTMYQVGLKFVYFVNSNSFSDFCITVKSDQNAHICAVDKDSSSGGPIQILHNNLQKVVIPSGFKDFNYCFANNLVDRENDEIQLRILNEDNVSF